ncbi:MAG: hypothetical protein WA802_10135 [Terracidiphilus sp.]
MLTSTPSIELSRRQLLKGIAAFSATVVLSGCNKSQMASASPVNVQAATSGQPAPTGPVTQALLSVTGDSAGTIGSGFAGLSYEKSSMCEPLFGSANADLVGLFELLGPGVLRVGGNSVDQCVWTPKGAGRTAKQIAPADVDALAGFLKEAGWQCIYGINLGGAATGATTPELAAAEVAYVAQKLGSSLLGIEIGNECDGYGATGSYYAGNWSLAQFEALWNQFRSAIQVAAPGVPITGPASGSNVAAWTVPFTQAATRKNLSLTTQHYYRGDGHSSASSAANLISPDANLPKALGMLSAASQATGVPFRIGECNSYFNGGAPGVSNSYASALWVIDFLFNCAQGGATGVNLHGGSTNSYTPIADNNGAVIGARPEFYGLTLFTLAGQGAVCETTLSAGSTNATAYAVKDASGGMSIVIVNKDTTQNLQLTVSLPQTVQSSSLMTMSQLSSGAAGPSLTATSGVTIQGASIAANGDFTPGAPYSLSSSGTQINCFVPALSAVLIQTKQ